MRAGEREIRTCVCVWNIKTPTAGISDALKGDILSLVDVGSGMPPTENSEGENDVVDVDNGVLRGGREGR